MELENWLKRYDIKKMVMENLKYYLSEYEEEGEDFDELFRNIHINRLKYEFHSVAYVINTLYINEGEEARKYISARVRLLYEDIGIAEYVAFYGLDGEIEDDYLTKI